METIILIGCIITLAWYIMLFVFVRKISNNTKCIREMIEHDGFYTGQTVRLKETKEIWTIMSFKDGKAFCSCSSNDGKYFSISDIEK